VTWKPYTAFDRRLQASLYMNTKRKERYTIWQGVCFGGMKGVIMVYNLVTVGYPLYSLLMCQNPDELRKTAKWAGVKGGSRECLMDNICGKWCFWLADTSESLGSL